jgi:hypothetical protein
MKNKFGDGETNRKYCFILIYVENIVYNIFYSWHKKYCCVRIRYNCMKNGFILLVYFQTMKLKIVVISFVVIE